MNPHPGTDGAGAPPADAESPPPPDAESPPPPDAGCPPAGAPADAEPPGADGAPDEAAVRARAAQLVAGADEDSIAGLRDLQNLTLSMGLPAARALFRHMVDAAGVQGAARPLLMAEIRAFSPVTEVGCMQVDFTGTDGAPGVAYLLLDQCPREHDLGAQLDKLQARVPDKKWPEVLKHLAALLAIGRRVYADLARQQLPLIRRIFGAPAGDPCSPMLALRVDPANTTLYLDPDWPLRVGLFVYLDSELGPGGAPGPAAQLG